MIPEKFFTTREQEFLIPGPAGQLQILTSAPETPKGRKVAVICHPHPQFGGTMQNKVVTTLYKAFDALGMRTVRFNYRGIGKSAGVFDEGIGETEDAVAALNWVSEICEGYAIYLAGFSFGAYISYRVAAVSDYRKKLAYLISVALPLYPEIPTLAKPLCPWLMIQAEADEVVDAAATLEWAQQLQTPPTIITLPKASHFFHGKLVDLRDAVVQNL